MIQISKNRIITINRGDPFEVPLFINQGNYLYPIRYSLNEDSPSTVIFAIMTPNQRISNAIIKKRYTASAPHTNQNDVVISLTSEETNKLLPGKYFYTIILNRYYQGKQQQIIVVPRRLFFVKE